MDATRRPRQRSWSWVPVLLAGLILAGGAGLVGCTNKTVKKVKALADRACACETTACADTVDADYHQLASHPARGSADDRDDIQKDYNRMRTCLAKVRAKALGQKKGSDPGGASPAPKAGAGGAGAGGAGAGGAGSGSGSGSGSSSSSSSGSGAGGAKAGAGGAGGSGAGAGGAGAGGPSAGGASGAKAGDSKTGAGGAKVGAGR